MECVLSYHTLTGKPHYKPHTIQKNNKHQSQHLPQKTINLVNSKGALMKQ